MSIFLQLNRECDRKETKIDDSYEILPVTPAYNDLGTNIMLH